MGYAIRKYIKGVKNSGTRDMWKGEYLPSEDEVISQFGQDGKYIVFQRGKGIRGMRKVAQYGLMKNPLLLPLLRRSLSGCQKHSPQKLTLSM